MLDYLKDGMKNLGWGCLCAILELLSTIALWTLLATVISNWKIVLAIIASLVFVLIIFHKYKVRIRKIWTMLDKSKLTYPLVSVMLLVCLCDMPYDYYTIVRLFSMGMFAYWAYNYHKSKEEKFTFMFGTLALLFQPFAKVELSRHIWNWMDVIIAIFILILWYKKEAFIRMEDK